MKSISFYTYSTFFSGGYKSNRFSKILKNSFFQPNIKCLVGLPESENEYFINIKHKKFKLHKILNKIPASRFYNKRLVLEKCFDLFSSFQLLFDNSEIIFTSIRLNFTAFLAKKMKKVVIFEGSEMHPLATLSILENEYTKIGIRENNIYNNRASIQAFLKSIKYADLIVCFTRYSYNSFIDYGVIGKNLVIINPGVKKSINPEKINTKNNNVLSFVSTANHTILKGTHKLLHAWSNINNKINAELIIVGELSIKLQEYIKLNNLNLENVFFVGSLNNLEIEQIYKEKNAVGVLLSLSEGGPRSVLEYISFGLPVIVTESCSFDLIINNLNGFVLNELYSIECVENSLSKFIENHELYDIMYNYNINLKSPEQDEYSIALYNMIEKKLLEFNE